MKRTEHIASDEVARLQRRISENEARLDVVNDILSFESEPAARRRYTAERRVRRQRIRAAEYQIRTLTERHLS